MNKNLMTLLILCILLVQQGMAQLYTGVGGGTAVLPNTTTSNQNVGIGTDTPEAPLHIKNSTSGTGTPIVRFTSQANRPFDILQPDGGY